MTAQEGTIWYKIGDDLLVLAEPFPPDSELSGLYSARFVRFISASPTLGEEIASVQGSVSFGTLKSLVRDAITRGRTPRLEELYGAVDRFVIEDRTVSLVTSGLDSLRYN
jgi:hypothetical protein